MGGWAKIVTAALVPALLAVPAAGAPQVRDVAVPQVAAAAPQVLAAPVPGVFALPVAMAQQPGSDDLYIVEKVGIVRAIRAGLVYDPVPVLDVTREVSSGLEQGLLGLAFSPDGKFMYVNLTDTTGRTRILEFGFADGTVVAGTRREVLSVAQPFANHNAGTLAFGPDGYLYIALGDGGSSGDPQRHGQNLQTLLGSMLRIDPRPDGAAPYRVPASNPFALDPEDPDKVVPPGALPEIWSYGLRNPWKFSFDRDTGDLWIADVGQNRWEEVNFSPASSAGGENYGWNVMEGFERYSGNPSGAPEPEDHVPPIHAYSIFDSDGCAVTGGYVYRGKAIPSLQGAYVFADWCDGRLRYVRERDGVRVEHGELDVTVPSITSFGEDHDGELYAISMAGTVLKLLPSVP
jgi:glucose/arabinose dehydrogenase